jgi:Lon-like ATP-dependent protease
MKESMRTAYTVAKNVLMRREPDNDFLEQAHIHVHVPEVCPYSIQMPN